jgi:DNA polymerase-1
MILILDGYNLLHRARSGFQLGDYNVAYNFFRSLRPLVDQFKPTRVYMALEGTPKRQLALLPTYKANRVIDETKPGADEKRKSLEDFWRQKDLIVDLLAKHFPISLVRHPDFEGDDVIYNLIKRSSSAIDFTIVSTDTDFIQVLQERGSVRLYNPVTKKFVDAPTNYAYVHWKALRGDGSDNIPGIPGIGDKRAVEMLTETGSAVGFMSDPKEQDQWRRNCELIRLHEWTDDEAMATTSSSPTRDWDAVKAQLDAWAFKSVTKDGAWDKFVATFDTLWGPETV